VHLGLYALQHRGQESAGIATFDGSRTHLVKDMGLVANVFTPERLKGLFPGCSNYAVQGVWPVRPMSPALLHFRTETLGLWKFWRFARCPQCGNETFHNDEKSLLYKGLDALNSLVHPRKSDYRWLMLRVDL